MSEAVFDEDKPLQTDDDYYQILDLIVMEGESIWGGEDREISDAINQLQDEGLAEWIEVGYGEANPELTEAGLAKYEAYIK